MKKHVEHPDFQQKSLAHAWSSVNYALEKQRRLGIADQLGVSPDMVLSGGGFLSSMAWQQRLATISEGVSTLELARG